MVGADLLVEEPVPVCGAVEPVEIRVERDRAGPVGLLGVEPAEPVLGDRAPEPDLRIGRGQSERGVIVGDRLRGVTAVAERVGAAQPGGGRPGNRARLPS